MTWFKVDDKFHSNSKTRKVLAETPSALALWTVAGSWSSDNLTDGFVPDHQLPWLIPNGAEEMARQLVAARFWKRVRGGYLFHEWASDGDGTKRNPTREEVEAERRRKAAAGRKGGLARAKNANREAIDEKDSGIDEKDSGIGEASGKRGAHRANADEGTPERDFTSGNAPSTTQAPAIAPASAPATDVLDPPTRPDPTSKKTSSSPATPATDEDFDRFWAAYPRRIAKGQARKAWAKAIKAADPERIIERAGRFAAQRGNEDPKFTPHASTWLNGERWADVPDPTPRPAGPVMPWELWD